MISNWHIPAYILQEVFWVGLFRLYLDLSFDSLSQSYPDLQPLYDAARSYFEIPQRINLLNTRVEVG